MGASNTKIINSLPSNLGALGRRDSKKQTSTDGTRKLVRVRSTSLDSISTALSFGTGPQSEVPSRASSLDNLHMAQFHSGHSRSTRSNGRRYMLLDNESVASSIIGGDSGEGKSLDVREPPSSTQPKLPLTRTKSDPLSSRSVRVKEPDTFSDNFVNVESNKELERPRSLIESPSTSQDSPAVTMETRSKSVPGRSILKTSSLDDGVSGLRDDPDFLSKLLADCPQINPTVLSKLSPEEWDQVISFACASLGKSLKLMKRLSDSHSPPSSETTGSNCSTQKHVTISNEVSTSLYNREGVEGVDPPTHERHRHRRRRRERPTSLPPTYLREGEPHPPLPVEEGEADCDLPRARAHSHEGHYYHRCSVESSKHRGHKSDPSTRTRRKKPQKTQRNPNAPVDVSLDDNCPGVARVRRFHRHTHHHSFCSHYTERGERKAIKDRPAAENAHGSGTEPKTDKSEYLTLQDMRTAASVLRRSAEVDEQDLAASYPGQGVKKRPSFVLKSKHASLDEDVDVLDSGLPTVQGEGGGAELNEGWNELAFPGTSRSGRDSPATDMAVINLDLNHPSMLVPLQSKKLNNNHTHLPQPQVLLHSHNHYHHIIHHTHS